MPASLDSSDPATIASAAGTPGAANALQGCSYRNGTDRMVIVRCCGPEEFYLERVVFPFEVLAFQCPAGSRVEIWTHGLGGPELVEGLSADELLSLSPLHAAEESEQRYSDTPWLEAS